MEKKGKIVVGIVVVVAVLILAVAMMGGSEQKTEVRYDYEVSVADSFTSSSGYVETPSAGKEYAFVTWTVANDSYKDGFSTNDMIFQAKVVVDGIAYSTTFDGMSHPGYLLGKITEGNKATFVFVYEIPAGTAVSDITVQFKYVMFDPPVMERDTTL